MFFAATVKNTKGEGIQGAKAEIVSAMVPCQLRVVT